jgi:hypothetical protein
MRPRARVAVLSVVAGVLVQASTAAPSLAATTGPFTATYRDEVTTPRQCPSGIPAGAFCFSGVGHGPTVPPGAQGTERFAGYVDLAHPGPDGCAPDFNAVTITTTRGTLVLTTQGRACFTATGASTDTGNWRVIGGTGVFEGASGSGTVVTAGRRARADGSIPSSSTYTGSVTLR